MNIIARIIFVVVGVILVALWWRYDAVLSFGSIVGSILVTGLFLVPASTCLWLGLVARFAPKGDARDITNDLYRPSR